jgi:hypothetical protein
MKGSIESTNAIVEMMDAQGRPFLARVWQGVTEGGVEFTAYIARTQVRSDTDCSEFERDLTESAAPNASTQRAIDLRFVI